MTGFDSQANRALPDDQDLSPEQSEAEDVDVNEAVTGLSELVAEVEDLEDVLARIADLAVTAVPGADGAGVTVTRAVEGKPSVLAWSVTSPFVRELDHLQYEICHEGPCLTAMETGRGVISGSIGSDQRWRRFGGRAARMGVHSALSLPLMVRGVVVGALNLYAHDRDSFDEHALRVGEKFALPAGVSVGNIQTLHAAHIRAVQLQAALTSRAVIDQAIGILRSRSGATEQEAFARLREISQAENVKLAAVAERMVDEAVRRARARHSGSEPS